MGDFNAHNPLWGSKTHNAKGKIIEDFVSQEGLCIFNDGSNTYLHPGNGSYSSIDITICDPSLLLDYSWRVHDDLCGSDHFPIVLEHLFTSAQQRVPRWKLDKADWSLFENLCRSGTSVKDNFKTSLSKAHDTACGPDNIHYQLLKHLPDSSLEALLQLMNNIWESGDLPSIWKLATVDYLEQCFIKNHVNTCQFDDERCIQNESTHTVNDPDDEVIVHSENEDNSNHIEENDREKARDLLIRISVNFVQDFLEQKLENSTSYRHTTRAVCMCEYVEMHGLLPVPINDSNIARRGLRDYSDVSTNNFTNVV
ncbi:Hypothetical predicted protein [Mytilus galloprovincialis]|uniref:Endonuclease/exonuclease/phosphatase domain-containing protein n=1 Tax=Mytilus galloprovincialis TaxID=29158 RepID=A0A8B6GGS5_MYTGA|nr:Hypothetical predicted protein [Mytilus galloprovincialis]